MRSFFLSLLWVMVLGIVGTTSPSLSVYAQAADIAQLGPDSPPRELYDAAMPLRHPGAYEEARRLLGWAVDAGDVQSMIQLAHLIAQGHGGERDGDAAMALYRRAAETGDVEAMLQLASRHERPQIGSAYHAEWLDPAAALKWRERAAETGEPRALMALGWMLESGPHELRDVPRARELYRRAAAVNHPHARTSFDRVSQNLELTTEQRIADYREALAQAASNNDPHRARARALSDLLNEVYRSGKSAEATLRAVDAVIDELVEYDFYAIALTRFHLSEHLIGLWENRFTEEQRAVMVKIPAHLNRQSGAPHPGIEPGQGWTAGMAAGPPRPALRAPFDTADDWEDVLRLAAGFGNRWQLPAILKDFYGWQPITPNELRDLYRGLRGDLPVIENAARGETAGSLFSGYHAALIATGMDTNAACQFARNEFLELVRQDIHAGFQAIVTISDSAAIPIYRDSVNPTQREHLVAMALAFSRGEPIPTIAAAGVPIAEQNAQTGFQVFREYPNDFRRNTFGIWQLSSPALVGDGEGFVRFIGSGTTLNNVELSPLSTSPRQFSARFENRRVSGRDVTFVIFSLGGNRHEGSSRGRNTIGGNVFDPQNRVIGTWSAKKRLDFDYNSLARQASAAGNNEAAIHYLSQAIRVEPYQDHYLQRGNIYLNTRDYEAAAEDYRAILATRPSHPAALGNYFLALHYGGRHEEALAAYDQLMLRAGSRLAAERRHLFEFLKAESLWHLDRLEEAELYYAQAVSGAPSLANRRRAAYTEEGIRQERSRAAAALASLLPRLPGYRAPEAAETAPEEAPEVTAYELVSELYAAIIATHNDRDFDIKAPAYNEALQLLDRLLALSSREVTVNQRIRDEQYRADAPGREDYEAGEAARMRREFSRALAHWESAAAQGNAAGYMRIAQYYSGQIDPEVESDVERAYAAYHAAAGLDYLPAFGSLIDLYLNRRTPFYNRAQAQHWINRGVGLQHNHACYVHYMLQLEQRRLNSSASLADRDASSKEMNAALSILRESAFRGYWPSMHEWGRYLYHGEVPTLRIAHRAPRGEHSLPLARVFFERELREMASADGEIAHSLKLEMIDRALGQYKARPWLAEDVLAALEMGIPEHSVAYLINLEKGDFYSDDIYRIYTSPLTEGMADFSSLSMTLMMHTRMGGARMMRPEVAAAIERTRASRVGPPPEKIIDTPELRARFAAGDPAAAYQLYNLLRTRLVAYRSETDPSEQDLISQAISGDYAPAQWLRVRRERLLQNSDPAGLDIPRGLALMRAAAETGDPHAAMELAALFTGFGGSEGVRPNYAEAEYWALQAIASLHPEQEWRGGFVSPENLLMQLYSYYRPTGLVPTSMSPRDEATLYWFRELSKRGGVFAEMAALKDAYQGSTRGQRQAITPRLANLPPLLPPFSERELERLKRSAEAGDSDALVTLADAYARGLRGLRQQDDIAVELYRRAAEAGSRPAMAALADHYENGYGVNKDTAQAEHWKARFAATKPPPPPAIRTTTSDPAALYQQANAIGGADADRALGLLRQSAAGQYPPALYQMGVALLQGRVIEQDPAEAVRYFSAAAEAGFIPAQLDLGRLLMLGSGEAVTAQPERGLTLIKQVANQSQDQRAAATAAFLLGEVHERGLGVDVDLGIALKWYQHAQELGLEEAADAARHLQRAIERRQR